MSLLFMTQSVFSENGEKNSSKTWPILVRWIIPLGERPSVMPACCITWVNSCAKSILPPEKIRSYSPSLKNISEPCVAALAFNPLFR